jgi:UDP-N-acetyl-D-mannosaminuronic acid transferase (WecB/TagA/CpsF family)
MATILSSTPMQRILGIPFFTGNLDEILDRVDHDGGLVVLPSGPGMRTLESDPEYRQALLGADYPLPDSGCMVLAWNLYYRPKLKKLSGYRYISALLDRPSLKEKDATLWVMPSSGSAERNRKFLASKGITLNDDSIYIAPMYERPFQDPVLLAKIEAQRPRHVFLAVGGGVQEPLGFYLRTHLTYRPAIHCIGAAIGFLSGDQVRVPSWVDHATLTWFWRIVWSPARFFPRYWEARHLIQLMRRYRDRLPDLRSC